MTTPYGKDAIQRRLTDNPTSKSAGAHAHVGGKQISYNPQEVEISSEPLETSGPVSMKIDAKTFRWRLGREHLTNALRPHIHDVLSGLPSHHFVDLTSVVINGEFIALDFTVVVPEKQ